MRYLVTATPRNALTQEVFAANADDAIALAIGAPNRWKINEPRPGNDEGYWAYGAAVVEEPANVVHAPGVAR